MEKKMTLKEKYARVIEVLSAVDVEDKDMLIEFLEDRANKLSKSRSGDRRLTRTQVENEKIKTVIVERLKELGVPSRIPAIVADDRLKGFSGQKISALLTQLKNDGTVVRVKEKQDVLFSLAIDDTANEDDGVAKEEDVSVG